ncbi:MAG TPA: pseudouridine synthase, partial [Paenibacillus sp.]|nr:pseudouridine synthase [Paenibacillus sp.]
KSRVVTIHAIDIGEIRRDGAYYKVKMTVVCSKGTYIRTLCVDIGRSLGFPAVMSALVRTGSGPIRREQCVTLSEAARLAGEGRLGEALIPIGEALSFLPRGDVSEAAVLPALQGRKLYAKAVRLSNEPGEPPSTEATYCLYGGDRLIGLYSWDAAESLFVPQKLFT